MNEDKKCPNCGQYKIQRMSIISWLWFFIGASAIFIITLPFELILFPALIILYFFPSMRKKYRWCRNCHWTDKPSGKKDAAKVA